MAFFCPAEMAEIAEIKIRMIFPQFPLFLRVLTALLRDSLLQPIDNTVYAIVENIVRVEVDKDPHLQIHKSKISSCLLEEDILKFFDTLQLNNYTIFNKQVQSQGSLQHMAIIVYRHFQLPLNIKTTLLQLIDHCLLIDGLQQSRAKLLIHIVNSPSYLVCYIVVSHKSLVFGPAKWYSFVPQK